MSRAPRRGEPSPAQRDLNHACYHGIADMALQALADGADLSSPGSSGKSPMHFAAMGGHGPLCSHLAALLPDAMALRDAAGQTPLHLACRGAKAEAAMALCRAGADSESRDDFGRRPIDCCPDAALRRELLDFERDKLASAWTDGAIGAAMRSLHGADGF